MEASSPAILIIAFYPADTWSEFPAIQPDEDDADISSNHAIAANRNSTGSYPSGEFVGRYAIARRMRSCLADV